MRTGRRQRWAPRASADARASWARHFGRVLDGHFHDHFPRGWTYLLDRTDGSLLLSGPGLEQSFREHLPHEHVDLEPELVGTRMLASAARLAIGRGWLPAGDQITAARWTVRRLVPPEALAPALLLCPVGHEITTDRGPCTTRIRCPDCGRDYDVV